jgi:hypothetical protein
VLEFLGQESLFVNAGEDVKVDRGLSGNTANEAESPEFLVNVFRGNLSQLY